MFTGIVEKVSKVEKIDLDIEGARLFFHAPFSDTKIGDSIAVNGACLSVVNIKEDLFEVEIMNETLNKTNLKNLKQGDLINLERALKVSSRLDGHIVQGHIDSKSKVLSIKQEGFSCKIEFEGDTYYIVQKGSITVNGVSLTVCASNKNSFIVSLIPQTLESTNLQNLKVGDIVNIEYDIIGKYIEKFIIEKKEITLEFLQENGF